MNESDQKPLTRDLAPFGLRIPPDLKERIKVAAEANNRSMNAEIISRLEAAFAAGLASVDDLNHMNSEIARTAETLRSNGERLVEMELSIRELKAAFDSLRKKPASPS